MTCGQEKGCSAGCSPQPSRGGRISDSQRSLQGIKRKQNDLSPNAAVGLRNASGLTQQGSYVLITHDRQERSFRVQGQSTFEY